MNNQTQNSGKNYSLNALISWIDYARNKGLMNKNTAGVKKAAIVEILVSSNVLETSEEHDVRNLNIDEVFTKYINLYPNKHRPDTMKTYKSRLKSAIELFIRYTDNPLGFSVNTPKQKVAKKEKQSRSSRKSNEPTLSQQPNNNAVHSSTQRISTPLPILLGEGNTIIIQNFPLDISREEADTICAAINGFVKKTTVKSKTKLLEDRTKD